MASGDVVYTASQNNTSTPSVGKVKRSLQNNCRRLLALLKIKNIIYDNLLKQLLLNFKKIIFRWKINFENLLLNLEIENFHLA